MTRTLRVFRETACQLVTAFSGCLISDPQGRMTIQQWNTKSQGVDYRLGPKETKIETCTFALPDSIPAGPLTVKATLYYQRLVKPVADFLGVPADETEPIEVNRHQTTINVVD